jgi:hypothetical protein
MTLIWSNPLTHRARPRAERRSGLRIPTRRPVKVLNPVTCKLLAGETYDLSPGGLSLELPASSSLSEGSPISVYVSGSPVSTRCAMTPARIAWLKHVPNEDVVHVGVEFTATSRAHFDAA